MSAKAFREYFGVWPSQAALLTRLFETDGPVACPRAHHVMRVHISHLRKAMGPGAIETVEGAYVLSETGRAECRKAITECVDASYATDTLTTLPTDRLEAIEAVVGTILACRRRNAVLASPEGSCPAMGRPRA